MNLARQLPFDFSPRPALGLDDFMVVPGNADAVAWLDRQVDWPNGMLAIYGPVGCGKTHLAHVWQSMSGAQIYDAADLNEETAFQWIKAQPVRPGLILEGADRSVNEAALFHLYNMIVQAEGSLLLTGADAPARWPVRLPDLASRLAVVTAVELAPPDDDLFAALLIKQFSDRQINVASDVITYLVARLERSFEMARLVVRELDQAALAGQRNVTKPLARQVLQQLESREQDI